MRLWRHFKRVTVSRFGITSKSRRSYWVKSSFSSPAFWNFSYSMSFHTSSLESVLEVVAAEGESAAGGAGAIAAVCGGDLSRFGVAFVCRRVRSRDKN